MKTEKTFLVVLVLLFLTSCQKENYETQELFHPNNETIEFSYKGDLYSSQCYFTDDSVFILSNFEANEVYQKIINLSNLATFINSDGKIFYFDSYEEQMEYLDRTFRGKSDNSLQSRATAQKCQLTLYKDEYYGSTRKDFETTSSISVINLGDYEFNDEMTSFRMAATVPYMVTFYRDKDFTGATITFHTLPTTNQREEANMGNYNCSSHRTWNDQATGFKLTAWL